MKDKQEEGHPLLDLLRGLKTLFILVLQPNKLDDKVIMLTHLQGLKDHHPYIPQQDYTIHVDDQIDPVLFRVLLIQEKHHCEDYEA